jgi:Redoxin
MKKLFFTLVAIIAITGFGFKIGDPLPIGAAMPKADNKMTNIDGKVVSLKETVKANGLLVMFSCNTCPYVIKNQQRTIAVCDYAQKREVGVMVLNSNEDQRSNADSFDAMKAYYKDQKYNWAYAVDNNSEMADAFGANRTPECFLFDKNLKLVYHGALDNSPQDADAVTKHLLKDAISELADGKEISVKTSRSVGCAIKRKQ